MIRLFAFLGVLSISFSAIFVRLANVSPVTATFFRATYAIPILAILWTTQRAGDRRTQAARWLAVASGLFLAADLDLWHESIALIGAGLGTVIPNSQVVFVALFGWIQGERLSRTRTVLIGVILVGLVLTSGLGRPDAYGTTPVTGVLLGVAAGLCYAAFLLMYRASNRSLAPPSGSLLDATLGMALGALVSVPLDPAFSLHWSWPAHGWLIALAVIAQVGGWLLIGTALPRLAVVETSLMLLVQPVFAILWGFLIFAERLSALQWTGAAIVVATIATLPMTKPEPRT